MPLLPVFLALLIPLALALAIPFGLVQRYRLGTARRVGRRWVATLNLVTIMFSAVIFVWASALTNFWVPNTFKYAVLGLAGGVLLGSLGVAVTKWEQTPRELHYTPQRWLVLIIILAVTARLLYGFWRAWHAWRTTGAGQSWHTSAAVPGSVAVGAAVLGYYLAYATGVYRRLKHHRQSSRRAEPLEF